MTDEELTAYLHLTPAEAAIVLPKLTPERRALYARMKQVEVDAILWMQGLGPRPAGVLIDTERSMRRKIARAHTTCETCGGNCGQCGRTGSRHGQGADR
jgi:hypothetical protein